MNDREQLERIGRDLGPLVTGLVALHHAIVQYLNSDIPPPPAESRVQMISRLYREVLKREPDPAGVAYWTQTSLTEAQIRAEFEAAYLRENPPTLPPPAVSGNPVEGVYGGRGNVQYLHLASTQVWSAPLPDTGGATTGSIIVGEVPGSPQPRKIEVCISRTKGLIDPAGNYGDFGEQASLSWFTKAYSIIKDAASAKARGYAWAPPSEGPWWVNIRLTYPGVAGPMQTSWNNGPYA